MTIVSIVVGAFSGVLALALTAVFGMGLVSAFILSVSIGVLIMIVAAAVYDHINPRG